MKNVKQKLGGFDAWQQSLLGIPDMRTDFYHLTALPIERALPAIAEKILAMGSRLAVLAESEVLLAQLDKALWTYRPDSFLPHGREGDQPVLLAGADADIGGYPNVALADGQWRDSALAHERVFFFFDETSISEARSAWRTLADRTEVERHYWKQDEQGRWREGP